MTITRKPYIINKAMLAYMSASIMNTVINNVYALFDGVLLGQFVGPDALSAAYMANPAIMIMSPVVALFVSGSALRTSVSLGKCDNDAANDAYSMAMISIVSVGVVFALLSPLFMDGLIRFICDNDRLYPLVYDYVSVIYMLLPLMMFSMAIGNFVSVSGNPKMCTVALTASVIANVIGDLIFIPVFGLGLKGAALSSALGSLVSSTILVRHLASKRNVLVFKTAVVRRLSVLKKNVERGTAFVVGSLLFPTLIFSINTLVLKFLGADGAFVSSCGMSMIYVSLMVLWCVTGSLDNVGALLWGQQDIWGLYALTKRCAVLCTLACGIALLVMQIIPESIAQLFGQKDPLMLARVREDLPIMSLGLPGIAVTFFLSGIYIIMHKTFLAQISVISIVVGLVPLMYFIPTTLGIEYFWYSFPLAGLFALIVVIVSSTVVWFRKCNCKFLTLLPLISSSKQVVNTSVECAMQSVEGVMAHIREHTQAESMPEWCNEVVVTALEGGKKSADLLITDEKEYTNISISCNNKKVIESLNDIASERTEVDVKRMYGINFVNIKVTKDN